MRTEATDQLMAPMVRATAPARSTGCSAQMQAVAHKNGDAEDADDQRDGKAEGELLGAKQEDLGDGHERGDGGHHDGGDA